MKTYLLCLSCPKGLTITQYVSYATIYLAMMELYSYKRRSKAAMEEDRKMTNKHCQTHFLSSSNRPQVVLLVKRCSETRLMCDRVVFGETESSCYCPITQL